MGWGRGKEENARGRIFHCCERTRIYCASLSPVKVPSKILSTPEAGASTMSRDTRKKVASGRLTCTHGAYGSCYPLWLLRAYVDVRARATSVHTYTHARTQHTEQKIYLRNERNAVQACSAAKNASALVTTINELSHGESVRESDFGRTYIY